MVVVDLSSTSFNLQSFNMSGRFASLFFFTFVLFSLSACLKDEVPPDVPAGNTGPRLILKFRFDSTQVRLNSMGQVADVGPGRGAQSPRFNRMSAHYVEFTSSQNTALGQGSVVHLCAGDGYGRSNGHRS